MRTRFSFVILSRGVVLCCDAAVLVAGPVLAQPPSVFPGQSFSGSSSRNAFGGRNFSNGGYSTPNAFGGQNYSNGWSSQPNVFCGQNFSGPGGQSFSTQRNVFGDQNFSTGGSTTPNPFGGFNYRSR